MMLDEERKSTDNAMDNLLSELITSAKGKELLRALIEKAGMEKFKPALRPS